MTKPMAERKCPLCGAEIRRVRRRPFDRLRSLFRPVQRYRCTLVRCGWEGNIQQRDA